MAGVRGRGTELDLAGVWARYCLHLTWGSPKVDNLICMMIYSILRNFSRIKCCCFFFCDVM